MMRKLKLIYLIFWGAAFFDLFGGTFTELAGDLPKVITADKSPYLIVADIYVPSGKLVHIEDGTVLLFKNFTSIHIRGMLVARGTGTRKIVFTSESDKAYNKDSRLNPTPYDWNGIYIHKDGIGTEFDNTKIMYSVKGIVSETKFIKINNCIFAENGRSNLTLEGNEVSVTPSAPFSHNISIKDATVDGVPVRILQDPLAAKRNIFRYSGFTLGVGGTVVGGIFGYQWYQANKEMKRKKFVSEDDLPPISVLASREAESQRAELEQERATRAIFAGIGTAILICGGVSLVYSFTF